MRVDFPRFVVGRGGGACVAPTVYRRYGLVLIWLGVFLAMVHAVIAQETPVSGSSWYVFVRHDVDAEGRNELIFIDALTGAETTILSYGERYTIVPGGVLFFDPATYQVKLAAPDGTLRDHPFIRVTPDTHRVEWVITPDGSRIAWTVTTFDLQGHLATLTTVADMDGANSQVVFTEVDTNNTGMRIFPLGFSDDLRSLYVDNAHLDGITQFITVDQYVNILALDLATGAMILLPGERGDCICGADLGAGLFVRLRLAADLAGFDVYVYNLTEGTESVIPALRLTNYGTAGDMLIAPDGTRAVYALAQIGGDATTPIRSVFVLVDLTTLTQTALTDPVATFVRPVEWTEDNSAIVFTSPTQDGTWKISLANRRLERIAEATYIGRLAVMPGANP